jgi:fatty acid desaturase
MLSGGSFFLVVVSFELLLFGSVVHLCGHTSVWSQGERG